MDDATCLGSSVIAKGLCLMSKRVNYLLYRSKQALEYDCFCCIIVKRWVRETEY